VRGRERDKLIPRVFEDCGVRLDELTTGSLTASPLAGASPGWPTKRANIRPCLPLAAARSARRLRADYAAWGGAVVKDAATRAGIAKRVYPHLLRHSWMTEMVRSGISPIQLSVIAGAPLSGHR